MKGLTEWNEGPQTWDPFIAVFHDSPDNSDLVSDVYMALWYDRHWSEAQANGVDWRTFVLGGILKYRPRDASVWKVGDVEVGQMRTLLSYSSACLVCRDFRVAQQVLVGTHIYRALARRNTLAAVPDVQRLLEEARVLHF